VRRSRRDGLRRRDHPTVTISPCTLPPLTISLPTASGRRNRRGPALPGLNQSTPVALLVGRTMRVSRDHHAETARRIEIQLGVATVQRVARNRWSGPRDPGTARTCARAFGEPRVGLVRPPPTARMTPRSYFPDVSAAAPPISYGHKSANAYDVNGPSTMGRQQVSRFTCGNDLLTTRAPLRPRPL
jgi:hypothetical protein